MAVVSGGQSGSCGNLVDDLENSFQCLFSALVGQDHVNIVDQDEIRTGVEQATHKFLDVSKEIESFFLQKRLLLSVHRPEQIVKEDVDDLKTELQRKDALVQKLQAKVQLWQENLASLQSGQNQMMGRIKQEPTVGTAALAVMGQQRHMPAQPPVLPPLQQHHPTAGNPTGHPNTPTGHPSGQYMGPLAHLEQAASQFGMR